jgi:hypothetical protein
MDGWVQRLDNGYMYEMDVLDSIGRTDRQIGIYFPKTSFLWNTVILTMYKKLCTLNNVISSSDKKSSLIEIIVVTII